MSKKTPGLVSVCLNHKQSHQVVYPVKHIEKKECRWENNSGNLVDGLCSSFVASSQGSFKLRIFVLKIKHCRKVAITITELEQELSLISLFEKARNDSALLLSWTITCPKQAEQANNEMSQIDQKTFQQNFVLLMICIFCTWIKWNKYTFIMHTFNGICPTMQYRASSVALVSSRKSSTDGEVGLSALITVVDCDLWKAWRVGKHRQFLLDMVFA